MSEVIIYRPPQALTTYLEHATPAMIAAAGDAAVKRFLEFFTATIANKNTRKAYRRPSSIVSPGSRSMVSTSSTRSSLFISRPIANLQGP